MIKSSLFTTTFLALLILSGCAQMNTLTGSDSETEATKSSKETEADKKAKADADFLAQAEAEPKSAPIPTDSPFTKINLGMADETVRRILGGPGEITRYRTGKSWIPFAGRWLNDTRRQSWFYQNMGVVVFSLNKYSGQYKVIRIDYNATQGLP